jgi:hypothetical protein
VLPARAPFSRARHVRPPLLTARTVSVSLILHLLLLIAVLFAPAPERPVGVSGIDDGSRVSEVVDFVEVSEWGGMATDPSASLPEPQAAAPAAIGAATADSVLSTLPQAGPFPQRAPAGIPAAPSRPAAGAPGAVTPGSAGGAPAGQAGGQVGGTGLPRSGPGRLGPELGDSRLVVRPQAVPEAPLEDEERYQRHIRGRLQAINDSISGEADRQRRANDWTITDRNGRRWGIDQNGVVAGGRHVPTPKMGAGRPQRDREDEARRERDQRREIDRQAEDIERDRYLRERGQATRERENRRREEERQKQEQGGTTP